MFTGIIATILGLIGTGASIYFKYIRKPPSEAKEVTNVNHKMLQDAVDRPTKSDTVNSLRDGTF